MPVFEYSVIDQAGKRRRGTVTAAGEAQARQLLAAGGDLLTDLRETGRRRRFALERSTAISGNEAAAFASELAALLDAGAPIRSALEIQSGGQGAPARLAGTVLRAVDNGGSLSGALRQAGGSAVLLSEFAAAGEAGAGLAPLLGKGSEFLSARALALARIREALAYPVFIAVLGIAAIGIITLYVAPALAPMLEETGEGSLVLKLAGTGQWLQDHSSAVFAALAALVGSAFLSLRAPSVRRRIAGLILSLPVVRQISRDLDAGQSCEILAALLHSGRPLDSSLRFAASLSGPVLAGTWLSIAARIREGEVISVAFGKAAPLPPELKRLALLGERSGNLAGSIRQAGGICHARAMTRIARLSAILGPAFVIGMGAAISVLMLSILGTLAGMGDAIQ